MVELLKQIREEMFPFLFYILMIGIVITHIILNLEDVFRNVFGKILIIPSDFQSSSAVAFYLLSLALEDPQLALKKSI